MPQKSSNKSGCLFRMPDHLRQQRGLAGRLRLASDGMRPQRCPASEASPHGPRRHTTSRGGVLTMKAETNITAPDRWTLSLSRSTRICHQAWAASRRICVVGR